MVVSLPFVAAQPLVASFLNIVSSCFLHLFHVHCWQEQNIFSGKKFVGEEVLPKIRSRYDVTYTRSLTGPVKAVGVYGWNEGDVGG